MKRAFKGVWIPSEIWLSKKLTLQEKAFLAEIDSLDNNKGCYASNKYFADFFDLSRNRCSEIIKSLEIKGFISITYIRDEGKKNIKKRVIKVVGWSSRGVRKTDRPVRDIEEGYSGKCEENNPCNNNPSNNIKDIPYVEIINYLNDASGKNYRSTTRKTKDLIKARWNEGFVVEDFKKVIDIKSEEWKNDEKMSKFIRPDTLFGTKFEGYLNQDNGTPPNNDGYDYGF